MNVKRKLLTDLASKIYELCQDENLDSAIKLHYADLTTLYNTNPNHFRFLFQNNRFILSTYLAIDYYTSEKPSIAKVKRKCLSLNTHALSNNTIYSLFDYYLISNRIKLFKNTEDKRTSCYYFTRKGEQDIIDLISVMIPAIQLLKNNHKIEIAFTDISFLESYFVNYSTIVELGYAFFSNVKDIELFISKNAGHLILMNLYCNQDKNGRLNISLLQLSKNCNVSRNHIRSIINIAMSIDLIDKDRKCESYILRPAFNEMIKNYMATRFICIMYCLGVL